MMGYYIIIRGALGSGKTTLSKKLATCLNAEYISIDEVLEKLKLDIIDTKEKCIPVKNFIEASENILHEAVKKLQRGKIIIFDGCFYHKKVIEHLIQNLPFPNYIFTLKAPLEVCIQRDNKRVHAYGKDAACDVYNLVSRFDYGKSIDVTGSLEDAFKEITSYLPKFPKIKKPS